MCNAPFAYGSPQVTTAGASVGKGPSLLPRDDEASGKTPLILPATPARAHHRRPRGPTGSGRLRR